jgi:trehalose-phosphatase
MRLALLFDYDGTLVPLAAHPRMAVLDRRARQRLEELARLPFVYPGVLSGRSIDDLKHAIGIRGLYYSGTNGLELELDGVPIPPQGAESAAFLVVTVAERVRHTLAGFSGAWVEQKPLGLTVHYRGVTPDRLDQLRVLVDRGVEPFMEKLCVVDGSMAVEITPDLGRTKGSALRTIIEHLGGDGVVPLYAGDAPNDADALSAAVTLGGVAIGIGPHAPEAPHRLPSPALLGRSIEALTKILECANARRSCPEGVSVID